MGFICEKYNENRVGLIVSFSETETNANFFSGDSVSEAMKHFRVYKKMALFLEKQKIAKLYKKSALIMPKQLIFV